MIPALIAGAASLLGGAYAARQARSAAERQAQAAEQASQAQIEAQRESIAAQERMYGQGLAFQREGLQTQLGLYAPQLQTGQQALAALSSGLGLGTPTATPLSQVAGGQQLGATQAQLNAAAGAIPTGQFRQTFQPSDIYTDPSYQFRLQEGLKALRAKQSAYGTLLTGQGMKDITNYAQGAASTEYQSAYERFMKNQEALYNRLSGLAGIGTSGAAGAVGNVAATQAQMAGQLGSNIGQTTMTGAARASDYATSAAAAQAAGRVGSTQAITGGLNRAIEGWTTLQAAQQPTFTLEQLGRIPAGAPIESRTMPGQVPYIGYEPGSSPYF